MSAQYVKENKSKHNNFNKRPQSNNIKKHSDNNLLDNKDKLFKTLKDIGNSHISEAKSIIKPSYNKDNILTKTRISGTLQRPTSAKSLLSLKSVDSDSSTFRDIVTNKTNLLEKNKLSILNKNPLKNKNNKS